MSAIIQQQHRRLVLGSGQKLARNFSTGLHHQQQGVKKGVQAGGLDKADGVFQEVRPGHEITAMPPVARLQTAVDMFRKEHFVDELPCRTEKAVAEAAAAGKGYVTPEDITRVMANITDGKSATITPSEADHMCETWGKAKTGAAQDASPVITTDKFRNLLTPGTSKSK